MLWKNMIVAAAVAGGLILGGFTVSHAEEKTPSQHPHHYHFNRADLEKIAKKLGIDPAGKTENQLKMAIKAKYREKLIAHAKELGIKNPESMSFRELMHAVHEKALDKDPERMKKFAEKLGVSTEGKTNQEIKQAIKEKIMAKRHDWLVEKAKELGINTEGKTDKELHQAIHKKWKNQR